MQSKTGLDTIVVAVCVAAYAAIMLAHVAREDLGLSAARTRHLSMLAAFLVALPIALDFLRALAGKAR